MKTWFAVLTLVAFVILVGCQCVPKAQPNAVVCNTHEVILSGADLCPGDLNALRSVLSTYDKKLYRLEHHQGGAVTETIGEWKPSRGASMKAPSDPATGQSVTAISSWTTRILDGRMGKASWVNKDPKVDLKAFAHLKEILCKYGESEHPTATTAR